MIDCFHLSEYGVTAVNYNRDLEVFPVLKSILREITNSDIYKSPTDMGVNMIGYCISNNDIVESASKREILRRYYKEKCNYKMGLVDEDVPKRIKLLMNELNIDEDYLDVVKPALLKSEKIKTNVISLKLPNGKIITGKETNLLSPASSVILNAIKDLTKIPDEINLLSPSVLEPIFKTRGKDLNSNNPLQLDEVMIALSICSVTNSMIEKALTALSLLKDCEAHATYMVTNGDLKSLKKLGIILTCEPVFYSENLFY